MHGGMPAMQGSHPAACQEDRSRGCSDEATNKLACGHGLHTHACAQVPMWMAGERVAKPLPRAEDLMAEVKKQVGPGGGGQG